MSNYENTRIFLNFSNHPSSEWSAKQLKAAAGFGKVTDCPFPVIDPYADEDAVRKLADEYVGRILSSQAAGLLTVHITGEHTFCFACVERLKQKGVTCLASCSFRNDVTNPDGSTTKRFKFIQFRKY